MISEIEKRLSAFISRLQAVSKSFSLMSTHDDVIDSTTPIFSKIDKLINILELIPDTTTDEITPEPVEPAKTPPKPPHEPPKPSRKRSHTQRSLQNSSILSILNDQVNSSDESQSFLVKTEPMDQLDATNSYSLSCKAKSSRLEPSSSSTRPSSSSTGPSFSNTGPPSSNIGASLSQSESVACESSLAGPSVETFDLSDAYEIMKSETELKLDESITMECHSGSEDDSLGLKLQPEEFDDDSAEQLPQVLVNQSTVGEWKGIVDCSDSSSSSVDNLCTDTQQRSVKCSTSKWSCKNMTYVNITRKWLREERQETRNLEDIPAHELNQYFIEMWCSVRKSDGGKYSVSSLNRLYFSLHQYIMEKSSGRISLKSRVFTECRRSLSIMTEQAAKMKIPVKRKGFRHLQQTTRANEILLWQLKILGIDNPTSLLYTVYYLAVKHFAVRNRHQHRELQLSNIVLKTDAFGAKYIEYHGREENAGDDVKTIHSTGLARDPVTVFEEYLTRRPVSMQADDSPFYLTPVPTERIKADPSAAWFTGRPYGVNQLSTIVTKISRILEYHSSN